VEFSVHNHNVLSTGVAIVAAARDNFVAVAAAFLDGISSGFSLIAILSETDHFFFSTVGISCQQSHFI
jgi:hypothetical protein